MREWDAVALIGTLYLYARAYACANKCIYISVCVCVCACVSGVCMRVYECARARTYTHVYICTCACVYNDLEFDYFIECIYGAESPPSSHCLLRTLNAVEFIRVPDI